MINFIERIKLMFKTRKECKHNCLFCEFYDLCKSDYESEDKGNKN